MSEKLKTLRVSRVYLILRNSSVRLFRAYKPLEGLEGNSNDSRQKKKRTEWKLRALNVNIFFLFQ